MSTVTTGVDRPSLRPLSTFSNRRTRDGTRVSVKTVAPSAASVGASSAAINAAAAQPCSGNIQYASRVPEAMVSGIPIRSRRKAGPRSTPTCRICRCEASEKSTKTRVTSAMGSSQWTSGVSGTSPKPVSPASTPTATNTIGAVTFDRANRVAVIE